MLVFANPAAHRTQLAVLLASGLSFQLAAHGTHTPYDVDLLTLKYCG